MKKSSNILGFAFLALAVTMTAMITMRNSPQPARRGSSASRAEQPQGGRSARQGIGSQSTLRQGSTARAERPRERRFEWKTSSLPNRSGSRPSSRMSLVKPPRITFEEKWLASLPVTEQEEWLAQAESVEQLAVERLERLTGQLELSPAQRAKVFPALVRSTPGFDPLMQVGGADLAGDGDLTPAEEIHAILDSEQQEVVENQDVDRQLWWQAVIDRLEADLNRETGGDLIGGELLPDVPDVPEPVVPDVDREAPEVRDDGNLFDLLNR